MRSEKPSILAIGLNPAWQKVMVFDEIRQGGVNRAVELHEFASGKGVNFATAAVEAGAECAAAQFTGGATGQMFRDDLARRGVTVIDQAVEMSTRTCVTLVKRGDPNVTELIEPARTIGRESVEKLLERVLEDIPKRSAIAICGTSPPGIPESFHAEVARTAADLAKPLLLDAYINIEPVLKTRSVSALKINRAELAALSGLEDSEKGVASLAERYGVPTIAITDGSNPGILFDQGTITRHAPPKVDCVNPIGAGDVVSAVFFVNILRGTAPTDAFDAALAAGSASCASILPINNAENCF